MRLAAGHRAAGLGGMKSKSEIPECWGIHGVHQSGHWDSGDSTLGGWDKPQSSCRKMDSITGEPMRLELGGVQVYRPLLSFSKERLMATCVKGGMPWFEDPTNTDPTLTPRNAIRYIFKAYSLPSALQKPSLLALSCRLQERRYVIEREAYDMLRRSGVGRFDTRAGTLVIRFAKPLVDMHTKIPLDTEDEKLSLNSQRQIARLALQLAIECVTPEERVSIKGESYAERAVFPSLYSQGSQQEPLEARNFSIASVKFTRLVQQHLTDPDHKQISEQECGRSPRNYLDPTFLDGQTWLISRQPYPSLESDRPRLVFQPNSLPSQRSPTWALYDGRYWIRVTNRTPRPLHVRPFCPKDMQLLRQTFRGKHPEIWNQLIGLLKKAAPGDIRFTLPVIVEATTVPGSDSQCPNTISGTERIVALPTLPITLPNQDRNLEFEIRYKKVPEPVWEWYEESSTGRGEGRKKQEKELTPRRREES
jgi:tRNA(Ile)-lysidine synthase